jgi:hypothetical protein
MEYYGWEEVSDLGDPDEDGADREAPFLNNAVIS